MRPRLVATDLDGTLVRSDETVSERSRAALRLAADAGATVVIVTGRPVRWLAGISEATGHRGLAIVSNGAGLLDLASGELRESRTIAPAAAAEILDLVTAVVPDATVAGEQVAGYLREAAYRTPFSDQPTRIVTRDEVVAEPLLKLLIRSPAHDADGLLAAALGVVGEELGTLTHSSRAGLIEISAAGVSKGSALVRLAASLGIDAADAVAFGDMPNDVPMLAWAGRSYAVGNAHPAAKVAATGLTASNDEDGVAVVLEELFS